jgi:SnoaL-like domain
MKYTRLLTTLVIATSLFACSQSSQDASVNGKSTAVDSVMLVQEQSRIEAMLDSFNVAATRAEYDRYFDFFAPGAVFAGTDATEYWNKEAFMIWAKPHFDRKQTWNFVSLDRHVYFDSTGRTAWFDELLDTQMKICRGSGVVVKMGDQWKIKQYILSMTIPNSQIDRIVKIKTAEEDSLIRAMERD